MEADILTKQLGPLDRITPIVPIETDNSNIDLNKLGYFIFFGPTPPWILKEKIFKNTNAWLSFGLYNVICHVKNSKSKDRILRHLIKDSIHHEVWIIKNGKLLDFKFNIPERKEYSWDSIKLTTPKCTDFLASDFFMKEYSLQFISILTKMSNCVPHLIEDLLIINEYIESVKIPQNLNKKNGATNKTAYDVFGIISKLNAALLRFSSQTLAGISPIIHNPCHLASHSLIGIGLANIALIKLRNFIQNNLGEIRIPLIFDLYKLKKEFVSLRKLEETEEYWETDHLFNLTQEDKIKTKFKETKKDLLFPLATYFSTRDGFRYQFLTLGVPLETLYACNTIEWSLVTITHEISHAIIGGILSSLLPDFESDDEVLRDFQLSAPNSQPKNLYEEIKKYFFNGVINIEKYSLGENKEITVSDSMHFKDIIQRWYPEIEEIMAHIFDFLYFYGADDQKYIKGIWNSWSVIPNISTRIPGYVSRTLCTIYSMNLRKGINGYILSASLFKNTLKSIRKEKKNGQYIDEALKYLKDENEEVKQKILSRTNIIRIVKTFIYSEQFSSDAFGEKWITLKKKPVEQLYAHKMNFFDKQPITNPLLFLNQFSNSKSPSIAEALWLFNNLAFNYENN
ncbi:hypothetical protein ACFLRG_00605 [Bacteroidota bacterium]